MVGHGVVEVVSQLSLFFFFFFFFFFRQLYELLPLELSSGGATQVSRVCVLTSNRLESGSRCTYASVDTTWISQRSLTVCTAGSQLIYLVGFVNIQCRLKLIQRVGDG